MKISLKSLNNVLKLFSGVSTEQEQAEDMTKAFSNKRFAPSNHKRPDIRGKVEKDENKPEKPE